MRVLCLSLLLYLVHFTSARAIPKRRRTLEPVVSKIEEQGLYENMNILRDLTLTTESIWDFEGVNFEEVAGDMKEQHYDCLGLSIACHINMGHIRPVCGFHHSGSYEALRGQRDTFASICELDYRNCLYRVDEKKIPVYGTDDLEGNDYMEWVGEANTCPWG